MALRTILLATVLALAPATAFADLAISANDGKQVRRGDVPMAPTPDSISVIAFGGAHPPMVIGSLPVCATMIGPPVSVAVAPDYSFALASCPQKLGADNKLAPEDIVSVIGLDDPTHPRLLQTAHAGMGATGVYMNKQATLALVSAVADDTVTLFTIKDRQLTAAGKVQLEAKSEPRDVVFAPDGKSAYVVRWGDGKITKLVISGTSISRGGDFSVGVNPDGAIVTPDGRYLINTNFGGAPGTNGKGAITVTDLRTGKPAGAYEVGPQPEHVALSPDGKFLLAVVSNGSATTKDGKDFDTVFGQLMVFGVANGKLTRVAQADMGHACQGAAFSDDGKMVLGQCSVERAVAVYHFDGKALSRDGSATLTFQSRPGAIATAKSR